MVAGHAAGQHHHGADDTRGRGLAVTSGFAVRRLTFDLSRPAARGAFALQSEMLRDGRKAKTFQVRLLDGAVEIARCTALLTAQGDATIVAACKARNPTFGKPKMNGDTPDQPTSGSSDF